MKHKGSIAVIFKFRFYLNVSFRWIFFALMLLGSASCRRSIKNIPEPNYAPHILQPGPYIPAQGKILDKDSLQKPEYFLAQGRYIKGSHPLRRPLKSLYHPVTQARYLPGKRRGVDMGSVVPPQYIPAKGKPVPSVWPEWRPAQPHKRESARYHFSYLDSEHGIRADMISCMIEAQDSKIWIGAWGGGISVWDGAGFIHFTEAHGLSSSIVTCLMQARDGKIWIGTGAGISVWDGAGFIHFTEEEGLSGNEVTCIMQDQDGKIWIGVRDGGLSVWDGAGFTQYRQENGLSDNRVTSLLERRNGEIWIGSWGDGVNVWDGAKFIHLNDMALESNLSGDAISCLLESRDGKVWIGFWGAGLSVWDGSGFTNYGKANGLAHDVVRTMTEDQDGKIWIGTSGNGVNVWDGRGFFHYAQEEGLTNDVIASSLMDSGGNIWLGAWGGGINIWGRKGFAHFSDKEGLGSNDVRSIMEDQKGRLWVGTNGAGISILDDSSVSQFFVPGGLNSNITTALMESRDGKIWIGSWGEGVSVWDTFGIIQHKKGEGLGSNVITCLMESRDGKVWIGTWGGGLSVWDGAGFTLYTTSQGLADDVVSSILEARDGKIWIGTGKGLSIWDGANFTQFTEAEGLQSELIGSLLEDEQGDIWISANNGGISVWDGEGFTLYRTEEGLRDDAINSLYQDKKGNIWAGAHRGLYKFSPKDEDGKRAFQAFLNTDGLGGSSIREILVDQKERLWLYTSWGLYTINLSAMRADTSRPILAMRELQTFFDFNDWRKLREAVRKGDDVRRDKQSFSLKRVKYDSVQTFTNLPLNPVFPHNVNQLRLSWQAIQWTAPHHLQYSYLLEGKSQFWSPLTKENNITFQDLRPGRYTFKVRAVGRNNQWSEISAYPFTILPPWQQTTLAKIIYLLLGAALIMAVYRYQLKKKLAEQEARQLKKLDELKSRFFANISHEFRTPLTIILGMIDQIEKQPQNWLEKGAGLIRKNGANLLDLINQILDLQKVESDSLKVNMQLGDIIPFLRMIFEQFQAFTQSKEQQMTFSSEIETLHMDYDPEKILRIVSNLLSNAIKYTPEKGRVAFSVSSGVNDERPAKPCLVLTVSDTGPGIPQDQLPYIFDRFYQANVNTAGKNTGTGIGLALTQELVKLLQGKIEVSSREGSGAVFQVFLPISQTAPIGQAIDSMKIRGVVFGSKNALAEKTAPDADLPIALIVEDNSDITEYLQICLEGSYQTVSAVNGQEGIDLALEQIPDVIVSDVMMPKKNGFELCETLKQDVRTSHIPIILLTAKSDVESRIAGLKQGADDYLAKPFNEEELLVRMQNLLEIRRKLQERYQNIYERPLPKAKAAPPSIEDAFILKIKEILEDRMTDPQFNLDSLSKELYLSRSNLYRKIKALTGRSPAVYLRSLRLQKAREMLLSSSLSIKQVAYDVGFSDPSYFSRSYADEFGESPSALGTK